MSAAPDPSAEGGATDAASRRPLASSRPLISRTILVIGVLLLVGFVLYELRGVLTPIFTALGIAYLLDPVVDRLEARKIPRGLGITIVLTTLALAVTLFSLLVLPGVVREVALFLSELPDELVQLVTRAEPLLAEYGIPVPHTVNEALQQFELAPSDIASHVAAPVQAVLRSVLGGTASAIGALASALIVPVLAFYLLYDFDRMTAGARDLVPPRYRTHVVEVADEIDEMLGQFVRGQLLVMFAMAVLYGIAYSLVGVRLAIPIALVAGLLAFIPYVGSGSAVTMGLLMCVVDWDGWTKPILVVVAYAVCQFLEGFVIVPRVVGDKVGLPAVWVLVALMIGGEVFGFLGVLLAVPTAAVVKIFVVRGLAWYRKSPYYLGGTATETPDALSLSLSVTASVGGSEPATASGTGSVADTGTGSVSDTGSGSGSVSVADTAPVSASDTGSVSVSGSGSDSGSASASASVSDTGSASDSPTPERPSDA